MAGSVEQRKADEAARGGPRRGGKRRRWIWGLVLAAAALAGGLWFFWLRVEFHLSRVRAEGHSSSAHALAEMGPEVLPRLYAELAASGRDDVGPYREILFSIIQRIRADQVLAGLEDGRRLRTSVAPVDETMAAALRDAYLAEPQDRHRRAMVHWIAELDHAQRVRFFCDVFGRTGDRAQLLVAGLPGSVQLATRPPYWDARSPWRGLGAAEALRVQAALRERLSACAVPLLLAALAEQPADAGSDPYGWQRLAAEQLVALAPHDPRIAPALAELLARLRDRHAVQAVAELLAERPEGLAAMAAALRSAEPAAPRRGVELWYRVAEPGWAVLAELACRSFDALDADARSSLLFSLRVKRGIAAAWTWDAPRCLARVLLDALEARAPAIEALPQAPGWLAGAVVLLQRWSAWDAAARARLRAIRAALGDGELKQRLAGLAD